jgi:hypothetical protein
MPQRYTNAGELAKVLKENPSFEVFLLVDDSALSSRKTGIGDITCRDGQLWLWEGKDITKTSDILKRVDCDPQLLLCSVVNGALSHIGFINVDEARECIFLF